MYNKSQIDILAFLDNYLKESSIENIQEDVREVSSLKFVGTSAKEYFANFHKYYQNDDLSIPETKISFVTLYSYSSLKMKKHFGNEYYCNDDILVDSFHDELGQESIPYMNLNVFSNYNNYKQEHEIYAFN